MPPVACVCGFFNRQSKRPGGWPVVTVKKPESSVVMLKSQTGSDVPLTRRLNVTGTIKCGLGAVPRPGIAIRPTMVPSSGCPLGVSVGVGVSVCHPTSGVLVSVAVFTRVRVGVGVEVIVLVSVFVGVLVNVSVGVWVGGG